MSRKYPIERVRNIGIIAHHLRRESPYSSPLLKNLSVFNSDFGLFPTRENSRFPDPFPASIYV